MDSSDQIVRIEEKIERIANALERLVDYIEKNNFTLAVSEKDYKEVPYEHLDSSVNLSSDKISKEEIISYLTQKNISIENIPEQIESDNILDEVADFMGRKYNDIKDIYIPLKQSLYTKKAIHIDLKDWVPEKICQVCGFCNKLHNYAILSSYKYAKSPHFLLNASLNRTPKIINFITGNWLERFIRQTIEKELKTIKVKYSYLINPKVKLPNGLDFELDILFMINEKLLWIEAKTGDYQNHIDKYSKIANILDIDKRSLLVLANIEDNIASSLSSLYNIRVFSLSSFTNSIKNIISEIL